MSLITSTAFRYNPAIQPRAFIALGCLAKNQINDDLLFQILVALRGALSIFEDNECNLAVSIVMCLCNVVNGLSDDSRYLKRVFWLAFALIQIGHVPIFNAALSLLHVVLQRMDTCKLFDNGGVFKVLLDSRAPLLGVMTQLDSEVGIHFRKDFAFAFSVNLMKGLKHQTTKTLTSLVLNYVLELSSKYSSFSNPLDRLGFIIPLLPSAEKRGHLFTLAGVEGKSSNAEKSYDSPEHFRYLLREIMYDNAVSTLTVCMMVTILEYTEHEPEILFIYNFLVQCASLIPDVFSLVYVFLLILVLILFFLECRSF